jgi:CO/xanthine dehydrogenase Mo-binding subunit
MRSPPETPYLFALESEIDGLVYALDIDPVELRKQNDTRKDPVKGLPHTSRSLVQCFDWAVAHVTLNADGTARIQWQPSRKLRLAQRNQPIEPQTCQFANRTFMQGSLRCARIGTATVHSRAGKATLHLCQVFLPKCDYETRVEEPIAAAAL